MSTTHTPSVLLRRREVERRTGLARATIYQRMAAGTFPLPVRLSARAVAWRESDIAGWIESRPTIERSGKR